MVIAVCLHEQYATNSDLTVQLHNTLSLSFELSLDNNQSIFTAMALLHSLYIYTQSMQLCHVHEYKSRGLDQLLLGIAALLLGITHCSRTCIYVIPHLSYHAVVA